MDTCAFPVHPNSANVVMQLEPLCTSRSSCSRLCKPCDDGSLGLVISSLTVLPYGLGAAVILAPPSAMLPLSIRVPCCWATACIPYFAAVLACPSSFCSLQPMPMMLPLHSPCWHGPGVSTRSVPVWSAWTLLIGGCASSLGFTQSWVRLRSFLGIPNARRTVSACHQPGPKRNWASVVPSSASLDAFSSSFISNAHPSVAGPTLFPRSP